MVFEQPSGKFKVSVAVTATRLFVMMTGGYFVFSFGLRLL
jgi:hypothetical protein